MPPLESTKLLLELPLQTICNATMEMRSKLAWVKISTVDGGSRTTRTILLPPLRELRRRLLIPLLLPRLNGRDPLLRLLKLHGSRFLRTLPCKLPSPGDLRKMIDTPRRLRTTTLSGIMPLCLRSRRSPPPPSRSVLPFFPSPLPPSTE